MAALLTILFLSQPELTLTFVILGAITFAVAWWLAPASRERIAGHCRRCWRRDWLRRW